MFGGLRKRLHLLTFRMALKRSERSKDDAITGGLLPATDGRLFISFPRMRFPWCAQDRVHVIPKLLILPGGMTLLGLDVFRNRG